MWMIPALIAIHSKSIVSIQRVFETQLMNFIAFVEMRLNRCTTLFILQWIEPPDRDLLLVINNLSMFEKKDKHAINAKIRIET